MGEVLAAEVAEEELNIIADFFGTDYVDEKPALLEIVQNGRLYFDENQKRVLFKCKTPIEKGEDTIDCLKFKAMTVEDDVRINSGFKATGNANDGSFAMDYGDMKKRIIRAISILAGEPIGIINRMGRKDFQALSVALNFLD